MKEVKLTTIKSVDDHPNADRLSINVLDNGMTVISNKEDGEHRYKEDDLVFYVPVNSILPDNLLKQFDLWDEENQCGVLNGANKNVLSAVRIRGIQSQGFIFECDHEDVNDRMDYSEYFGITFVEPVKDELGSNEFVKYPKIYNLSNTLNDIPLVYHTGKHNIRLVEKVHGTNAAIVYNKQKGLSVQKRTANINTKSDNMACAYNVNLHKDAWIKLHEDLAEQHDLDIINGTLYIFAEFAGNNIQQKACVSGLKDKVFFIFEKALYVKDDIRTWINTNKIDNTVHNIFNISNFPSWNVELDFDDLDKTHETLDSLLATNEKSSPIGKHFGFDNNILEGFVGEFEINGQTYRFKHKGLEHGNNVGKRVKVKTNEALPEELEKILEQITPEWRFEQGYNELEDKSMKSTGKFIKWVIDDVREECKVELVDLNNNELNVVLKQVAFLAKQYIFSKNQ